jgi:predicted deacylase
MRRQSTLTLPPSSGRGFRELPVLSISGPSSGPRVAVTANVHGDECTGVGVALDLADQLEDVLQSGTVHLYPSLNPEGLSQRSRVVPADGADMNRLWPGDARGGPAERQAKVVWEDLIARAPALVIDIHTDSPASVPYTIVDRVLRGDRAPEHRATELAEATGLTVLHEYPIERYVKFRLEKSLSGAVLNRMQVPAITIEAGPRLILDPQAIEVAKDAVFGALTAMGMMDKPAAGHATCLPPGPWRRESGPRVSCAGLLQPLVQPGEHYTRGQALARVRSLEGRILEHVRALGEGYVISLPERAWVVAGVSVGTHAVADT